MKYLKTIVVLILLIVLPLTTVYYLTTGNNYGKKNYESSLPKGVFKDLCNSLELPKGKVSLLVPYKQTLNNDANELIKKLSFELKEEPLFAIKYLVDSVYVDIREEQSNDNEFDCKLNSDRMVLVDIEGRIRNHYGYKKEDFNKLMEDLPFVIPRKIKRDIVEKKYETQ